MEQLCWICSPSMIQRKYELVLRGSNRGIWGSRVLQSRCWIRKDGGSSETVGGNSSRRQRCCRSSTLATTAGGNGSFIASISCSHKLDDDGGERSWVWWMEEVAVTTIFVGGGKSSSGRGLVRQPYDTSSLFRLTGKDEGRDGVGYGMRFDGDSR
ncbi:unnamed protein product [Lactuca saligna]|uniref:Uncharacterized protein n=1 Tax=Lactuca saligna TaxID=75948 RepID=A0AA35YNY4_LACSI|nr:unnamed protein product [Lactuca saligna]